MTTADRGREGFDAGAAVTRSLLGWGVVAGPFYLVAGLGLALTRPGFRFADHQLSLLMLGDGGWMQITNIVLTGLMVLAAALGVVRSTGARAPAVLLGVYGVCLILSGVFPPDPLAGFPAGAEPVATLSGITHLAVGAIGFGCLAAAAFVAARWFARRGDTAFARTSRVLGGVVVVGFVGGAALSTSPVGVLALWVAVVAGFAWLFLASLRLYAVVPHPDAHRRDPV